jgi:CheY-like chemotaxis protein
MPIPHALIVDDNQNNIDILIMLLEHEGLSHSAVRSVKEVEAALSQLDHVDVVFLDLEFPTGNGFKLLETLKANPQLSRTPIVAYTVHVSEIHEARRAGFDSFLGKPVDTQKFPDHLKRILSGESVWEP